MKELNKIFIIGITGSAGAGKSLVRKSFERLGLLGFDADSVAREVVEPGQKAHRKLVELFGNEILDSRTQNLNRSIIRERMIKDTSLRKKMEDLLHPIIIQTLFLQIHEAVYPDQPACAVEVPLLFELGMRDRFNFVVSVVANESDLVSRIALRDSVSRTSAQEILSLQMSQEKKSQAADYVIYNDGKQDQLYKKVKQLYEKLQKEFLTKN